MSDIQHGPLLARAPDRIPETISGNAYTPLAGWMRCGPPRRAIKANFAGRARFNREADLAATLFYTDNVGVHDRGEFAGQLWIPWTM